MREYTDIRTSNMSSSRSHVHLSCPDPQSSPMGLPLDIEEAMTASVDIRNTEPVMNPSQGHGPRLHTSTPPAYVRHVHYSPELIFNQSTPPSSGADRDLTALDRQQHPYDQPDYHMTTFLLGRTGAMPSCAPGQYSLACA